MSRPSPADVRKKLIDFDNLPDDCIVTEPVAAALLSLALDTYRRQRPLPRLKLSKRRFGVRVGDLRNLIRGSAAA